MAPRSVLPWYTEPLGNAVAQSFGKWLGPKFQELERRGHIVVTGRERVLEAVRKGNCIIAGNHPSVIDDFITAGVFYPHYLEDPKYFIWSVPDRPILKSFHIPLRAAPIFRMIVIDREDQVITNRGFRLAKRVLQNNQTVSLRVEDGRTGGQANKNKMLFCEDGRSIREIGTGTFKIAIKGTTIVPHYLKMPYIEDMGDTRGRQAVTIPRDRLYGKYGDKYLPLELHFGEAFTLPENFSRKNPEMLEKARQDLQDGILRA
jgi:1-acyl-sn-glycerol-3-phosphate acyltransferase